MKLTLTAIFFLLLASASMQARQQDTVFVSDYGIRPYTYENQTGRLRAVIDDCKRLNAKVLVFKKGRYDFWPEDAVRKEYFITNTSTEQECPSKVKTIGLFFEEMQGLTVEGNDATLMFHGKMTMIAFAHSKQMKLRNLHIDFERPGGSEITYTRVDDNGVEVSLHRDSRYEIENGKIHLYGEGWCSSRNHCIEYDPENKHFFYSHGWNTLANTPADFRPKVGNTLTVRDIIRDQVGMFIYESQDVTLENVGMHYMHGLGIVSQYTRNITMRNVTCAPREGSGRILASSADFMHFSGCSGKISILGCRYAGAQDDPINVHGTNLRAVKKVDDRTIRISLTRCDDTILKTLTGICIAPLHVYGDVSLFDPDNDSFGFTKGNLSSVRANNGKAVGAGEYAYRETDLRTVYLDANENYWLGVTDVPEVILSKTE